jgi:trehalose 6-phosphate synthase/phosphatase
MTSRVLLVSNRLPVTVRHDHHGVHVVPSAGGLATGLREPHERSDGLWFGWPGELGGLDADQRRTLDLKLAELRTVPIALSQAEVARYYEGLSNGVLWPLFHYLLDHIPFSSKDWEVYRKVNERFADSVVSHYRPGDVIWIHDYQLFLVPELIRRQLPDATIGFFLHIPFPSFEVFRLLPWREVILRGLLGADLIGFHTASYLRHFASSLLHILGLEVDVTRIVHEGRVAELGVFPMGIDVDAFTSLRSDPDVLRDVAELRRVHAGTKIMLGIDRLDYTKGVPRRLLAFERLLEREPSMRRSVKLVQVGVPTRSHVDAYDKFRRRVDELVGRINGTYATVAGTPIHYLHRGFSQRQVTSMYRAADVMLVTPLRDGMNLVAKEYVACRDDDDGVLVLSEFAGAASQLAEAISVNPYDIDGVARAMKRALTMPAEERTSRMHGLRERVLRDDVHHWVQGFLEALTRARTATIPLRASAPDLVEQALAKVVQAQHVVILLDYDGTLVPFASTPQQACPDAELIALLSRLARTRGTSLHIVSGRPRTTLEEWLGHLPIGLHAEHGLWSRWLPTEEWVASVEIRTDWKERVQPILADFAARTPGAFVEEKLASLAWHYRLADAEFGSMQSKELRLHLLGMLSNLPVQVVAGEKTVEVRPHGVHKGLIVDRALARSDHPGALVLAMGDDRTDEDLFAAVPEHGISVHVGASASRAALRLANPASARQMLDAIATMRAPFL